MPTKEEFRQLISDRTLVIPLLIMLVLSIGLAVYAIFRLHISGVQLPIRYSDYGSTNTYRDKWYYLLSFPLLGLFIAVFHTFIAAKLKAKNRELAVGFIVGSVAVLVFGAVVTAAVMYLVGISI